VPQNISVIVLHTMKDSMEKVMNVIETVKMLTSVYHITLQLPHGLTINIVVMMNVVVKKDILGWEITT
jgi:hypothetical protein